MFLGWPNRTRIIEVNNQIRVKVNLKKQGVLIHLARRYPTKNFPTSELYHILCKPQKSTIFDPRAPPLALKHQIATNTQVEDVGFFEVVTPQGGVRVFICASDSCFGSHAFVSRPIWSNQRFTDSQNYALAFSCDIRFLPKSESKWGLSRANTTPCDERGVTTSKNPTFFE
eukprot:sb/3472185/